MRRGERFMKLLGGGDASELGASVVSIVHTLKRLNFLPSTSSYTITPPSAIPTKGCGEATWLSKEW